MAVARTTCGPGQGPSLARPNGLVAQAWARIARFNEKTGFLPFLAPNPSSNFNLEVADFNSAIAFFLSAIAGFGSANAFFNLAVAEISSANADFGLVIAGPV
jgi:hypothetical protein